MKKAIFLAASLFVVAIVSGQVFEGKIIYQNTYKSKSPQLTDAQWSAMLGTRQEYSIKGGDYKSELNGSLVQWQLYSNANNKLYSKITSSETVYWNDGAENKDEVLDYKLNKGVVTILGNPCDELVLNCRSGIQKYYFSANYKIDTALFAKHKFGNWHEYVSRSGAVPLRLVVDNAHFVMESVATEIIPMALKADAFILPAGTTTAKSPS